MQIFDLLKANKGTVSSALGKDLADKVLKGDLTILNEAVVYVNYDIGNENSKNIRAGAAKILEKVAEKKPDLVAPYLDRLKLALDVNEPQTRWMLMQVFGFCAHINPNAALSIMVYADRYLKEKAGVCLSGAVHLYLGRVGAISDKNAKKVLPILDDSLKTASENEIDWILEAFLKIIDNVDSDSRILIESNAKLYLDSKKKSTKDRATKIIKKIKTIG